MQEVRKLAKTQQWFLEIIKKAPSKVKEKSEKELDENKINLDYFSDILDYIADEASITPPTSLEKHQLFEEFNSGKQLDYIVK
jgi:hypothetical protein